MAGRRFLASAAGAVAALLIAAAPAEATFHLNRIREVYPGSIAEPTAEYVELQAMAAGQKFVSGQTVTFYGASGTITGTTTFSSDVTNGESQDTILIGTATAHTQFGVTPDLTIPTADLLSPAGGAVCWGAPALDCVSWGSFSGSLPSSAGTPAVAIPDGSALQRTIARGCPTALDEADDTNNSSADFAVATPNPRNNAAPPNGVLCTPRSTSTSVNCMPSSVVVSQPTTCTATVTDTAAGTPSAPSGNVAFSSDTSGGSFGSLGNCTLSPGGYLAGESSCHLTYTPGQVGSGTHKITGSYGGDGAHSGSHGETTISVSAGSRSTSTSVNCMPSSVVVSQPTTCTATVTDTAAGTPSAPSGNVAFSSDTIGGRYNPSTHCTLSPTAIAGQSNCQLTYSPGQVGSGTHKITGSYGGDGAHATSQGFSNLGVSVRSTSTSVNCMPSSVVVSQPTTCTATVTDTAAGTSSAPSGNVAFSSDTSGGSFGSLGNCTLVASGVTTGQSSCQSTYTPGQVGSGTHEITGSYGGDGAHATGGGSTTVGVSAPPIMVPPNAFSFGKFKANKNIGSGSLAVSVPGPGVLSLSARGIATVNKQVSGGSIRLAITPIGRKRKMLVKMGKAKIEVKVTFAPAGGTPNTQFKTVELVKKH